MNLNSDLHQPEPSTHTNLIPQFANPNVENNAEIYMAVYSSIPVYEMTIRGVGVMRRESDSYMNATQILKVAGLDKPKRTRIMERDIMMGEHEKVQGGYGKYQGTWIPFHRAYELAKQFEVLEVLAPLFDYLPGPTESVVANDTEAFNSVTSATANKSLPPNSTASSNGTSGPTVSKPTHDQPQNQQSSKRERMSISTHGTADEHLGIGPSKRSRFNTPSHQSNASDHTTNGDQNQLFKSSMSSLLPPTHSIPGPAPLHQPAPCPPTISSTPLPKLRPCTSAASLSVVDRTSSTHDRKIHTVLSLFDSSCETESHLSPKQADNDSHGTLGQVLDDPDLDINMPLDECAHTPLHWASALARISLTRDFIKFGADVFRGNNVGETPLIRATLVTTNFDHSCFDQLLELLYPSLCTTDHQKRTILHHICLTAGIKSRVESARYYMECIFEWIVKQHEGRFEKEFVDAIDYNGDTALNIAARVGNKHLVQMLLDVGASKSISNKLGLGPADFGVCTGDSSSKPLAENDPPSSIPDHNAIIQPERPRTTNEIIESMTTLLNTLTSGFDDEIQLHSTALERVLGKLKTSSHELTEQRRLLEAAKQELDGLNLVELRLKKLRKKIEEEDQFDWTGRSEVDGSPARDGKAFEYKGIGSTLVSLSSDQIGLQLDPDPEIPTVNTPTGLVYLRRMENWYRRVLGLLQERIRLMKGCSMAQEAKYLKIISTFVGCQYLPGPQQSSSFSKTPRQLIQPAMNHLRQLSTETNNTDPSLSLKSIVETNGAQDSLSKIDIEVLNQLIVAMESDGPDLDLNRVAGFMSRVNAGLV
ncbi:hypothetical protein DFH28DRAFT_352161 [Melampsora americana]|nr:hypothetical protein DFH28DRAFT_352161 [Melampsora americana]